MEAYDIRHINVLIVEDNRHMRFLLKTILQGLGIKSVEEAEDGSDALKLLQTFPADLIVTDWLMEPLDGIDLIRMIRTGSDTQDAFIPIIMLTGYTEVARVQEARDAGVTEFLAKPISSLALYHRMVQIIEKPRYFIQGGRYTGPDRRRREANFKGEDKRSVARESELPKPRIPMPIQRVQPAPEPTGSARLFMN
ncbi:MAG: response regulator [Rhodospirillaceae bacterium]|nr:response regulator [Rhodospirillaceae bacterium]